MIADSHAAALVGDDGSIDWLCLPRFDSPSLFGRLLDDQKGGFWQLAPTAPSTAVMRYRPRTGILETQHESAGGSVLVSDLLLASPDGTASATLVRLCLGLSGAVELRSLVDPRPDFGRSAPALQPWGEDGCVLSSETRRRPPEILDTTADALLRVRPEARRKRRLRPRMGIGTVPARRGSRGRRGDGGLLGTVVRRPSARRPLRRPRHPQRAHAQAAHVRSHRRDRRGADHVAAGEDRRRRQLGLPVHVAQSTRRSRSKPCSQSACAPRGTRSSTGSAPGWARQRRRTAFGSCTTSTAAPTTKRPCSRTWRATVAHGQCESGTPPAPRCSSTSTERSSTSTRTPARAVAWTSSPCGIG